MQLAPLENLLAHQHIGFHMPEHIYLHTRTDSSTRRKLSPERCLACKNAGWPKFPLHATSPPSRHPDAEQADLGVGCAPGSLGPEMRPLSLRAEQQTYIDPYLRAFLMFGCREMLC